MASNNKLATYINRLESYIPQHKFTNTKISKATIGWQIDHSLKVINNVCLAMQSSDPNTFEKNMTFIGKFLLTLGRFPRGKAKAPKHVRPPEIIEKEALIKQIADAKKNIESINTLPANAYFKHPMFGHINKKRVTRFLEIHTKHHLNIIKDMNK
ncbi:DUF1569 domain-containing protein [Winogradskyella litorisediminis]|uniref:DUF1569 domain-containing protein n=1 Tax=Winogradskyella litorisediminis TaxID=1156618 RepID=A0ABW3N5J1_9FLAO